MKQPSSTYGNWLGNGLDGAISGEPDSEYIPEIEEEDGSGSSYSGGDIIGESDHISNRTRHGRAKRQRRHENLSARVFSDEQTAELFEVIKSKDLPKKPQKHQRGMSPPKVDPMERSWKDIPKGTPWNFVGATVLDDKTGRPLKYANLKNQRSAERWKEAEHTEFIRLVDSGTIRFIRPTEMPKDRTPSYYNPQPEIKTKDGNEVYRIRGTYGGDRGDPYDDDKSAYVADATTVKCLLNKEVSTDGVRLMTHKQQDKTWPRKTTTKTREPISQSG